LDEANMQDLKRFITKKIKLSPKKDYYFSLFGLSVFGIITALTAFTGVCLFFALPSTPISVTLPANVWVSYVLGGGLSRTWFTGFFLCYFWFEYKRSKPIYQKWKEECSK
jgi:hypothetical protein